MKDTMLLGSVVDCVNAEGAATTCAKGRVGSTPALAINSAADEYPRAEMHAGSESTTAAMRLPLERATANLMETVAARLAPEASAALSIGEIAAAAARTETSTLNPETVACCCNSRARRLPAAVSSTENTGCTPVTATSLLLTPRTDAILLSTALWNANSSSPSTSRAPPLGGKKNRLVVKTSESGAAEGRVEGLEVAPKLRLGVGDEVPVREAVVVDVLLADLEPDEDIEGKDERDVEDEGDIVEDVDDEFVAEGVPEANPVDVTENDGKLDSDADAEPDDERVADDVPDDEPVQDGVPEVDTEEVGENDAATDCDAIDVLL